MAQMDLTALALPDDTFSLIWCSHVLEHIEDDHKAMSEMFRVLHPSGLAIILIPVKGEMTYEDPSIKLPEDRLKHFRQEDHVRIYGHDIRKRLTDAGFQLEVLEMQSLVEPNEIERYGLDYPTTREIFLCTKHS